MRLCGFAVLLILALFGLSQTVVNPDTTETRLFLNFWWIYLPGVVLGYLLVLLGHD